ncbi:MAG: helix-turn-helix domain-containing protein [Acidimicrobiales bacterium]|nr:helix-turn-helix domain-containing protein [Acidimicrobiales bacterium]
MAGDADSPYLTPGQAARMLGVSPKTVNRWATDGRIPCAVTLGGHRRFRLDVIRSVAATMGLQDPGAVAEQPS